MAHSTYRDLLGIYYLDSVRKKITFRFSDVGLDWCTGSMPTPHGSVTLCWQKQDGKITYRADYPAGYELEIKTIGDLAVSSE